MPNRYQPERRYSSPLANGEAIPNRAPIRLFAPPASPPPSAAVQVVSKLSKEESVDKLSDALDKLLEGIRALVTLFCRRYSVSVPKDWVSHSQAQLNAITSFR